MLFTVLRLGSFPRRRNSKPLSSIVNFFSLSLVLRRLIFLASDVERGEKKQLSTVVAPAVIVMKNSLPIFFEFFIRFSSSVLYYTKGWACPPAEVHHHSYIRRQEGAEKIQLTEIRRPTCLDWEIDCSTALFLFLCVQIEQVECPIFISSIQPISCKLFIWLH